MVKKKEENKNAGLPVTGTCTFSQDCDSKTDDKKCTWVHGCAYRQ